MVKKDIKHKAPHQGAHTKQEVHHEQEDSHRWSPRQHRHREGRHARPDPEQGRVDLQGGSRAELRRQQEGTERERLQRPELPHRCLGLGAQGQEGRNGCPPWPPRRFHQQGQEGCQEGHQEDGQEGHQEGGSQDGCRFHPRGHARRLINGQQIHPRKPRA